jgi:hypothetical protein
MLRKVEKCRERVIKSEEEKSIIQKHRVQKKREE